MNPIIIIIIPLISAIIILMFGRKLGVQGAAYLSISNMALTLITGVIIISKTYPNDNFVYVNFGDWMNVGLFNVKWGFFFDTFTLLMVLVVTSISTLVHFYSYEYMHNDPYNTRFFAYLSLFSFFMLVLVSADNLILLFLGWEGVGICSYLLIGFWNTRILANKSSIKALIINRIGDVCLVVSISIIFYHFKTVEYSTIFVMYPYFLNTNLIFLGLKWNLLNTIGFFMFVGCMAKSAQIGLHTWLPDAMEGPTPVSALIHAATMVTAGVFLIIRFSPTFEFMPKIMINMIFVGALTTFLGATIGMLQNDIKKIVAYSTCSQLGYMILSCGISNYSGSLFHLINHAFFKALLFLSAGAIIHTMFDEQDIRKMGGLLNLVPLVYVTTLIGSLALAGFPFLSGFYSKDFILESTFMHYSVNGNVAFWFGSISAFFTAYYSFRLIYLVFFFNNNSYKSIVKNAVEPGLIIYVCLVTLTVLSVITGYLLKDAMVGSGTNFLGSSTFTLPWNSNVTDVEYLPFYIKIIPVILSLLGVYLVLFLYSFAFYDVIAFKIKYKEYYTFFNNKWYFNNVYNYFLGKTSFNSGYTTFFTILEQGLFEPTPVNNLVNKIATNSNKFMNNNLRRYTLFIIVNLLLFLVILLLIV